MAEARARGNPPPDGVRIVRPLGKNRTTGRYVDFAGQVWTVRGLAAYLNSRTVQVHRWAELGYHGIRMIIERRG